VNFHDQVVWITGSSTGIGKAAALEFSKHGANVIVHANQNIEKAQTIVEEIKANGRKAFLVHGDVSNKEQVEVMVKQIDRKFGKIDVLVNNAGALIKRARLENLEEDLWDQIMDVNLKSVYLVTKAVLPLMKKQGTGRIINITSIAAKNGGGVGSIAYAASKGGVSTLTRGLAKDLIEYNILVNAIAPGVITTPFHDKYSTPEQRAKMVEQIPLGREGTPEETVGSILFLASKHANYITGEIIEVNGGQLMS
jgi:3-oxoacyl-[acyl-carrier protein] reductase